MMTSYRADLGGLLAILCTTYCKYKCDNKAVINNVFSNQPPTMSQHIITDYDLMQTAKHLLTLIPATIIAEWVIGHCTGKFRDHYGEFTPLFF